MTTEITTSMKTIFTTKFLAILALATMTLTSAARKDEPIYEKIEVDGIYYEVHDDKLEVIKHPQGYSGVVIIPGTVMHGGKPYTVTTIDSLAFKDCDGLLTVGISSTVNNIKQQSFLYCLSLEEIHVDPNNETYASYNRALYDKAMTTIIQCPQAVEEDEYELAESVTNIGERSFINCRNIKKIILPSSVNFIGNLAFNGCDALADVTNLSAVPQKIDKNTFSYFGTLHVPVESKQLYAKAIGWSKFNIVGDIIIEAEIEVDGIYYKINDDKLDVINHPQGYSGVVTIPETVMYGNKLYTVTTIDSYAFRNCKALTNVKLPDGITAINEQAFYGCTALADINIPANLTIIGTGAFSGCGIKEMYIPNHVTEIGINALQGCKELERLTLPDNMTFIPDGLLNGCTALAKINIPQGVTHIGANAFSSCKSLKEVKLPNGVTSLENNVFTGCTSLESVYLPDGITDIKRYCFRNCKSLKKITIPANVTTIGYGAFSGCEALADVTNLSAVPQTIDENTFSNVGTLHVPAESEQLYAQAEGWRMFNIVGDATAADAIDNIGTDREQTAARHYGIDGKVQQTGRHHGITIVRTKDGKTRKVAGTGRR